MKPGTLRVMEPVPVHTVPIGQEYIYQVKWDGIRMVAFVDGGKVILQTKRGLLKTAFFPELDCLGNIRGQPLVLDGEIVVIRKGKPDFSSIMKRNSSRHSQPLSPPATYIVFDILSRGGEDLRGAPLADRQGVLAATELPSGPATIIDNFKEGRTLFGLTGDRGWEGIVAKDLGSPYRPGKSDRWKKIKHRRRARFWVIGYKVKDGRLVSLLLGHGSEGTMAFAGAVAGGLSDSTKKGLQRFLGPLEVPPFVQAPQGLKNARWVRPVLEVNVEYMEWTESLVLRGPVVLGLMLGDDKFAVP